MSQSPLNSGMPAGTSALFFTQLFSTLSFSVLYSTLILFATKYLHLPDDFSTSMMGTFVAFNYALHLLGGYAGGRYLSYRSLFSIGMVLIIIGCGFISQGNLNTLYWGLAFFLTGAGVNVTCINCMLTQLFHPDDMRREAAFLWNYSGMNVGFFIGFSMAGYFQIHDAYTQLFGLSAIGNVIALLIVLFNWKKLADIHTHISHCKNSLIPSLKAIGMIVVLIGGLRWLLQNANFSTQIVMIAGAIMGCLLLYFTVKQPSSSARKKMWAYLILAISSLMFWAIYQMIPMGLTLFLVRNVARDIHGFLVPPQWFENINTVIIIIGGPLLAHTFSRLRRKGYNVNIPFQFAFSLIMIGASMLALQLGIYLANPEGYVGMLWPVISYLLMTLGELFISPIGYAMVGKLAPPKLRGIMMGTWMMLTGISATLSSLFSQRMLGHHKGVTDPLVTNPDFSHTFFQLGTTAIAIGILMFAIIPALKRMVEANETENHETSHTEESLMQQVSA